MSIIQPPLIKYNLKERGRQFTGQDRDFNIPAIVNAINSPACQERIKKRCMLGFLGHWVRIRFGLEPAEGGVDGGQIKKIEPAIITTHLKAYDNGDIEHQTEFLDNPSGLIASRMYHSKVGGFSSVIDEVRNVFWGFDWVNEPNYSTNRGYAVTMDSVNDGSITIADILEGELFDRTQAMNMLLEISEHRERIALDSANSLSLENDQLLTLMADMKRENAPDRMKRENWVHTKRFEQNVIAFDSVAKDQLPFLYEEMPQDEKSTYKPENDKEMRNIERGLNFNV